MIIDSISDLHGHYPKLEGGDLLIIAGDLTARDRKDCWLYFYEWMNDQKYKKIIFIAGNHDNSLIGLVPSSPKPKSKVDFEYLCDSGTEFGGLKIWGSPWTQTFEGMNPKCMAFTVDTDDELEEKWAEIPNDIHILITHCPPYGIFDKVKTIKGYEHCGSRSLRYFSLDKSYFPKKKLHVFGHIHEWGGQMMELSSSIFVNASNVNERYEPFNKPVRIIL